MFQVMGREIAARLAKFSSVRSLGQWDLRCKELKLFSVNGPQIMARKMWDSGVPFMEFLYRNGFRNNLLLSECVHKCVVCFFEEFGNELKVQALSDLQYTWIFQLVAGNGPGERSERFPLLRSEIINGLLRPFERSNMNITFPQVRRLSQFMLEIFGEPVNWDQEQIPFKKVMNRWFGQGKGLHKA